MVQKSNPKPLDNMAERSERAHRPAGPLVEGRQVLNNAPQGKPDGRTIRYEGQKPPKSK